MVGFSRHAFDSYPRPRVSLPRAKVTCSGRTRAHAIQQARLPQFHQYREGGEFPIVITCGHDSFRMSARTSSRPGASSRNRLGRCGSAQPFDTRLPLKIRVAGTSCWRTSSRNERGDIAPQPHVLFTAAEAKGDRM